MTRRAFCLLALLALHLPALVPVLAVLGALLLNWWCRHA